MQPRFPPQGSPRYFRYLEQKLLQHHVDIQRLWKRMPFFTSGGIGEPLTGFLPTADGPSGASNTGPGSMAATPGVGSDAPYTNQPPVYVSGVIDYFSNTPGSYRSVPDGPISNTPHSGEGSGAASGPRTGASGFSDGQGSGAGSGQGSGASGGTGLTLSGTPFSGTPLSGTPFGSGTAHSGHGSGASNTNTTGASGFSDGAGSGAGSGVGSGGAGGGGGASGTFTSGAIGSCGNCSGGAARRYKVTISGLADGTCSAAGLNTSHIVTHASGCLWQKSMTVCELPSFLNLEIQEGSPDPAGSMNFNINNSSDGGGWFWSVFKCLAPTTDEGFLNSTGDGQFDWTNALVTVEPA